MKTEILLGIDPTAIDYALFILESGGLVAFPTDTVYGVAANAMDHIGIERLYDVKEREANKAIPILIGDLSQLSIVTLDFSKTAYNLAKAFWPGALTLIVPRNPALPANLSPNSTIGIRMPDHPIALSLLCKSGPLATTSANLSGGLNPVNAQDVEAQLGGRIRLIIDGGNTPGPVPSTVVDCTSSHPTILRQGKISAEDIFNQLK